MPTKKGTISVRLEDSSKQRIQRAAQLSHQSSGAFLEKAGDQEARRVLLDWALERRRREEATFSELAAETGLAVEEIMLAAGGDKDQKLRALDAFLASCRALAEAKGNPKFLSTAEDAARRVRKEIEANEL